MFWLSLGISSLQLLVEQRVWTLMRRRGVRIMKKRLQAHSQLQPFFLPRASGNSGLGASFTFSSSLSLKASDVALAAILADCLVGVSTTLADLLTLGVLGAGAGLESVLSASAAPSSALLSSAAGLATFFSRAADLPLPRDLDLRVPVAFFNTLESALYTSLALMV